jgi:CubicO group peptidase (beta-lactamase class C family)
MLLMAFSFHIRVGESKMLCLRLLSLALSFTMSAPAPSGQSLQTITPDTVILTIPLSPGEAPIQVTLRQMMDIYKDPGFSVAIIDHNRVAWANGFGVTAPGGNIPVTPTTLFQAASISKPITAAGGLWLVQRGKVSLDEDVNLKLKSWKVPENEFTATQKVTLRRLMSHNAGLNVHGFAGYPQDSPLPTTEQTLDGLPPANNPPIRVTVVPGTQCIYSGGGVTLEGLLIRDVSHQSVEEFMRRHVLVPAGMTNSTFQQHLPPALAARAATGTRGDGQAVAGKWHLYPELAPDGLWTTPTDLAKFAIEIALSEHGNANHILSQPVAREMLTVQCHDEPGGAGGIALGFGIGYRNHPSLFRHNGGNDGFESLLTMDADAGWGYAAMGNSDNFETIDNHVVETVAKLNGWDYPSRPRNFGEDLFIIKALRGIQAALDHYQRVKSAGFIGQTHDYKALNFLGYSLLSDKDFGDAITVFKLNVAEYPQDANTYDSLAEAYMDAGDRDLAIQNYEESLRRNPKNENAASQLKKLGAK